MGGFAALSNSHLASSVLVFGPQTEACLEKQTARWAWQYLHLFAHMALHFKACIERIVLD